MKFEFGDLYKFAVSAGLAFAAVAMLLLWLLLREPFDLLIKEADLNALSLAAQNAIRQRQAIVETLLKLAPWGTPVAAVLGLVLAGWGVLKWHGLQNLSDQIAKLDFQVKQASVRQQTEDEAAELNPVRESDEVTVTEAPQLVVAGRAHAGANRIEERFAEHLQQLLPNYTVQYEMMVGDIGVDVILRGGPLLSKDYLVEVKVIRRGFNAGWLLQVALTLRAAALVYENAVGRAPNTCLIVGVEDAVWSKRNYLAMRDSVLASLPMKPASHRIAILKLSQLEALDVETLKTEFGLAH
ncbi:hypothetical protein CDL60_14195 [Roseateles noduli]|nr:hypothetical protein CDL60_14195 [Roseateles noduli]